MEKKTGLTKDVGWQFGVRKSFPLNANEVWDFLFSDNGTKLWLKNADKEFSTFKDLSHVRTKWKLKGWINEATLQMRVLSSKGKTTIAFHIDKLLNENQREETKTYWTKILENITKQLNEKATNS
ncbi:MAG: hypothetical protein EOO19_05125 [Chryseobacterium sp.]|nr:MAG: hypothetical protein EOO19_05125 [Chryseobacterium sp.]